MQNLILKSRRLTVCAITLAAAVTSCSNHDFDNGYSDRDDIGNDHKEAFTKAFINEFGLFKGQPYSAAMYTGVTVRTAEPTVINVFADIDGQRFIFASLGSVTGKQSIPVTVPSQVTELIVEADGEEHIVKIGGELDLTKTASRAAAEPIFVDKVEALKDFEIVPVPDAYREIGLNGSQLRGSWLGYETTRNNSFHIFDSEHNFETGEDHSMYLFSRIYASKIDEASDFTIYPLYWRENIYGEDDYMLGIYYYHNDYKYSNGSKEVKMIDLDDFDLKSAISFRKTGSDEYVISQHGQAYDVRNLGNDDSGHFKGYHIKMKNVLSGGTSPLHRIGFYIKSGLKDTYTPGKGRDFTHISFMGNMLNAYEWGNKYWDTPVNKIMNSYSGAVLASTTVTKYETDFPEHIDGLEGIINDTRVTSDYYYFIIGFTSQPDRPFADCPDYSDVVLALTFKSMTYGVESPGSGKTYGTYPWYLYLACEDLGSTDDWDFNDLVVTVYDLTTDLSRPYMSTNTYFPIPSYPVRRITVVPRAVGSTLPIYLMYEGDVRDDSTEETFASVVNATFTSGTFVVGTEMHEWLGESDYTKMLNTGDNNGYDGCAVSFCIPLAGPELADFDYSNVPQEVGKANESIRRFWVLVDKEDEMRAQLSNPAFDRTPLQPEYTGNMTKVSRHVSQTENVLKPFSGKLGAGSYKVSPPSGNGDVPQMLMCQYSWRWVKERANISDAYSSFLDWVAGNRTRWHGNPAPGESTNGQNENLLCDPVDVNWMQ